MNNFEIPTYCTRLLDMVSELNSEASYSNSFSVEFDEENSRLLYILTMPSSTILSTKFYQKIYKIWNIGLFPYLTLLRQSSAVIVKLDNRDFSQSRVFAFPYILGIPERLKISNFNDFANNLQNQEIPIMKNLTIDYNRISCLAIAGSTGSGKSTALALLIRIISRFSDVIIVDPKFAEPSRLAENLGLKCLSPVRQRSNSEFLARVNEELSKAIQIIYERQDMLFKNPNINFKPYVIVIDELVALKELLLRLLKKALIV